MDDLLQRLRALTITVSQVAVAFELHETRYGRLLAWGLRALLRLMWAYQLARTIRRSFASAWTTGTKRRTAGASRRTRRPGHA